MKIKDQYALISVFDKINLNFICKVFKKNNIKIISTGSTSKYIKKIGYKCISVSSLTKKKSDKIEYAKSQNENAVIIEKKNIRTGFMKVNQQFGRNQIKSDTKTGKIFKL